MDFPVQSDEQLLALLKAAAAEVDKIAAASIEELRKADSVPGGGASEASPEGTPSGEETPGEATPGASPASPPSTASAAPSDSAPPGTPESAPAEGAPVDASMPSPGAEGGNIEMQLEQEVAQLDPDSLMKLKAAVDKKLAELGGSAGPGPDASAPPVGGVSPSPAGASPVTPPGLPVQKNMPPMSGQPGMAAAPGKSPVPSAPMVKAAAPMGQKNPDLMVKPDGDKTPNSSVAPKPLPTMNKSEIEKLDSLRKAEIASVKGEVSALSKKMDLVISAMDKLFVPTRKAVTDVAYLGKSEADNKDVSALSKSEIDAKLRTKISSNLSGKDKDLMMGYFLGELKADAIKHLL